MYAAAFSVPETGPEKIRTGRTERKKETSGFGRIKNGKGEKGMKTLKLRDGFYWVGISDADLRVFDIIMYTEFGTTYNSYILKAGDKTVLFETAKEKYFDDYLEKLREITDIESIDYLVVDHTEPDHAGSVERLLELCPGLKIVATPCAVSFLKEIVNRDFTAITVKDNQEMKIGNRTLRFMVVPNLHWPDTMYTYIEEEQILVTCDSFGSHYASEDVLVSKVTDQEGYLRATKYYFDCIIGPFKPFMKEALDRVRQLDVSMICTGHGPVLDTRIDYIMNLYEEWCTVVSPNKKKTVIMPYVSAYGYTRRIGEKIAQGIRDSGDIDVRAYDLVTEDSAKVLEELSFADGILFGTPTIVGEALKPIWDLTTSMFAGTHSGKLASAFGSYGWSGEGVPHILERLRQLRMKVTDGFTVRFKPSEVQLLDAYEYGYNFGCLLQEKENPKKSGRSRLVKCLVCGAIFDSSLSVCPVCGVGAENFVPVEETEQEFSRDTDNFYVILGNGAAGFHAASEIRKRDRTGSVIMISNEPYASYNRPMLTKSILADLDEKQIAMKDDSWYEKNNIIQMLGKEVSAIDPKEKEVVLSDGIRMKYTKLIYALGAECFVPPIKGADQEEVIAIRRLDDVRKVERLLGTTGEAVVIGGGVLGLEAAWELRRAGLGVTVLELAPVLMGRQLDESAGEMLKKIAASNGIAIHTGVQIEEIEGNDGHVSGVRLGDGTRFPAQMVIVSCGVRGNTKIAQEAGIRTERSIVVNEKMETSIEDVYACGDCAEFEGINYGIWPQAAEQGKTAGANAAGDEAAYTTVPAALSFQGMNTSLYAIGDNGKNPDLIYKTVEFKDESRKQYAKYYFLNNRLCGVILIGDTSKMARVTKQIEEKALYQDVFSF